MTETQDAQRSGVDPDATNVDVTPKTSLAGAATKTNAVKDAAPSGHPASGCTPAEDTATKIFQFLATATPAKLSAVAAGLGAATYLVLGRVGLLLIGAFAGAVALIQWEGRNPDVSRAIRGEASCDMLARLLTASRDGKAYGAEEQGLGPDEEEQAVIGGLEGFQPETRAALDELIEAIIRDHVKWWYGPIVPSDKFFPLSCRKVLTSFLVSASAQLARKRPADAFLDFLTNSSSIVIVFLSELSNAFADLPSDSTASVVDMVYNYLASNPDSNLSNLLNQKQQAGKLRMIAEDLLSFLDQATYNCEPAKVFLREVLAGVVLESTLQTCSRPEWINGWIVYLLEAGEPDFNQAIDVGMQTSQGLDHAFVDFDGNVGNIGLSKGNRNSFDAERARRKESSAHKKRLSKADEEMESAMEEMKRINQMIADDEARRMKRSTISEAPVSPSTGDGPQQTASSARGTQGTSTGAPGPSASGGPDMQRNSGEVVGSESCRQSYDHTGKSSPGTGDAMHPPATPVSNMGSASQSSSPKESIGSRFTSFDQIVPPAREEPEPDGEGPRKPPPLTLHNANITILDEPGDGKMRGKPSWDYLIQIEPATTQYPGWMIVRKYSDFEPLHEILRRIAIISGAATFAEQHNELPSWKAHTRTSLRCELEQYLLEACRNPSLAESEGMKKFLEKDQRHPQGAAKSGLQAFEKIGKNVFGVLASAPVEGSKAVVGGVTGVLGNIGLGQKKLAPAASSLQDVTAASRLSISTPPRADSSLSLSGARKRDSADSQRSSVVSAQPGKMPPMERRPSYNSQAEAEPEPDSLRPSTRSDPWDGSPATGKSSTERSRASSLAPPCSPSAVSLEGTRLPLPPDRVSGDYEPSRSPLPQQESFRPTSGLSHNRSQTMPNLARKSSSSVAANGSLAARTATRRHSHLSEQETSVAVELLFAVINELYTLSSAWNIRRTLLAAAKSFLLRPGNPSLASIRSMIQASVLDANCSDAGVAAHLKKIRENVLPTEEERTSWPAEMSAEEKEKLRIRARKLFIQSGVPAALSGVMGQSATSEALGRVFDCLQVEETARGLMFGILLQAARIVTH